MSEHLHLDLVTPEAAAFSGEVAMVEVPGTEGDFGVLPGHAPFMSMIRPGVVTIHSDSDTVSKMFITAGYAEVNPEGCVILAESLENIADLSLEDAKSRLSEATTLLASAEGAYDQKIAQSRVAVAEAMIEALAA